MPRMWTARWKSHISALKSSPTLRWERRETDEKEMPTSEHRVYRQLVGKLLWVDRVDLRRAMGQASSSLGRASDVSDVKVSNENGSLSRKMSVVFQPSHPDTSSPFVRGACGCSASGTGYAL